MICKKKRLILEQSYFPVSITSNRDFGKFLKILEMQTDTVFVQSSSNSYDDLLVSRIFFP